MRYDNTSVRRQDRLLDEARALQILHEGEYGFLALVETRADAVAGYGIPISYVFEPSTDRIYLHCGPEGHKLRCPDLRPLVTFTVVGHTRVVPAGFTTAYESVLLRGHALRGLPPEERMHALELLIDKYSPNDKVVGLKYAEKSFHRTEIIRIDIDCASGKQKVIRPTGATPD